MKYILISFALLVFSFSFILAQSEKMEIRKGNRQYYDSIYDKAEIYYRKAIERKPGSEKANYNLGNTLYKQNQIESSVTKYESLINSKSDPDVVAKYYYNLGNAYFKSKKLEKCIEAYKQSLRLNPKDQDAKHNLFLAQNMLQQQNQQNKQDQQNKNQDKQDQQNKDQDKKDQQQNQQNSQQNKNQQQDKKPGKEQQISKEDAERLLEALEQDEKNVMRKLEEQQAQIRKIPVDKEW